MTVAVVLLTSLLSSLLTWGLAWFWFQQHGRNALDQRIQAMEQELERRVQRGALAAGEELLPKLREQVKLGFQDALSKSEAAGLAENAAGVVNLGADIVSGGLSALFGIKPKK